jgi:soluble lytic murein transglycosylase-like protein
LVLAFRWIPQASVHILEAAQLSTANAGTTAQIKSGNFTSTGDLSLFTPEVRAWEEEILRWASEHDLPPTLVAIVMQIESCGARNVNSSAGAIGLFQVMPFHFSPKEDPYDPEVNAARGLNYLARSYELAGGSIAETLAGYNGGHTVIYWDPANWPEETRRYVIWGAGIWADLQSIENQSDTLNQWLTAGGESLCRIASEEI